MTSRRKNLNRDFRPRSGRRDGLHDVNFPVVVSGRDPCIAFMALLHLFDSFLFINYSRVRPKLSNRGLLKVCSLLLLLIQVFTGAQDLKILDLRSDGVDRDSGGESGCRVRAGRNILSVSLPVRARVPIQSVSPDPPRLTVRFVIR